MAVKSFRANTVPQEGITATTPRGQAQQYLPNTVALAAISERLMMASEKNNIMLNTETLTAGQETHFQIQNVGLGHSLELLIEGSITIDNTDVVAQVINLAPEFPFNLVRQLQVEFNGQTTIANLNGYELLSVNAKRNKAEFLGRAASGVGGVFAQNTARVSSTRAWLTGDANLTVVAGNGLTGAATISVAAASIGVLTFGMVLELPFTLREDLLFGILPMQNNSVYSDVRISVPGLTGITAESPLSVAAAWPATAAVTSAITVRPAYNFWTIPDSSLAGVVEYLAQHSYMLISQGQNAISATGAEAFRYNMPLNYFLLSMLFTLRDSTGALVDIPSTLDNPFLNYNGTVNVGRKPIEMILAKQNQYYEGITTALGQFRLDQTDLNYLTNNLNQSKWLDMYQANNPNFTADLAAAMAIPGTFRALRETIVPASVKIA